MPRKARKTSQSGIYHVMLRGVNRQRIFETESDYLQMQEILAGLHVKCDDTGHVITDKCCKIFAYCLMGNHLHLLIKEVDITIGDIIKSLASRYVFYFNRCHCRVGHLFQERFKSEPVESPEYFIALLRYIHLNPVKAGIVRKAEFHNLPFNERKAACLRIRELGAGVRQLARMTGLCLATISGK